MTKEDTVIRICSRPLQIPIIGWFANHSYIEAPPHRYAIIGPLCKPTDGGPNNVITGAVANKLDYSPEPTDKKKKCVLCKPKPGISDVTKCLRNAFNKYNNPSLYKAFGPNSNTFTGTLARACCDNMVPKPTEIGPVPGWDHESAPKRDGICPISK